ncbi:hypothetical protein EIQ03_08765 [Xanthomonas campestris pv. raphani]
MVRYELRSFARHRRYNICPEPRVLPNVECGGACRPGVMILGRPCGTRDQAAFVGARLRAMGRYRGSLIARKRAPTRHRSSGR